MKSKHEKVHFEGSWNDTLKLPSQENTIFLDIETDPGHTIWLIGVLHEFQLHQFIARTREEEIVIIYELMEFLRKYPNNPIMCYSGTYFDFRILLNRSRLHNIDLLSVLSNRLWIDLCIELRKVFSSPVSYQLKDLAQYYDYPLVHNLDGQQISYLYRDRIECQGGLDNNFVSIALEYNSDDLMLLPFLMTKFEENLTENPSNTSLDPRQIVEWIQTHIKLVHRKANGITFYISRSLEKEGIKYLQNICIPPKIRKSKYHIALTWENFAKDVLHDFLKRYSN